MATSEPVLFLNLFQLPGLAVPVTPPSSSSISVVLNPITNQTITLPNGVGNIWTDSSGKVILEILQGGVVSGTSGYTILKNLTINNAVFDSAVNSLLIAGKPVVIGSSISNGQVLTFNGGQWIAASPSASSPAWTAITDAATVSGFVDLNTSGFGGIGIIYLNSINPSANQALFTLKSLNNSLTGSYFNILNSAGTELMHIDSTGAGLFANGLTLSAGGLTVTAGGISLTLGGGGITFNGNTAVWQTTAIGLGSLTINAAGNLIFAGTTGSAHSITWNSGSTQFQWIDSDNSSAKAMILFTSAQTISAGYTLSVAATSAVSYGKWKPDFRSYTGNILEELMMIEFGEYSIMSIPGQKPAQLPGFRAAVKAESLPSTVNLYNDKDGSYSIRSPDDFAFIVGCLQAMQREIEELKRR